MPGISIFLIEKVYYSQQYLYFDLKCFQGALYHFGGLLFANSFVAVINIIIKQIK